MTAHALIILGTGGNAGDLLDIAETREAAWRVAGFLDDVKPVGALHLGLPVLGRFADALGFSHTFFVNAVGSPASYRSRPAIVVASGLPSTSFAVLVHARAAVSSHARIGEGTAVNAGASIAAGVVIGRHVTVGPGAIIGHDTVIEDHAMIAPGAVISGGVHVGQAAYVGAASCLRQKVRVGPGALIGMGSVVLGDVPMDAVVVGNPARLLQRPPETFFASAGGRA